jgi:hypothetical protein
VKNQKKLQRINLKNQEVKSQHLKNLKNLTRDPAARAANVLVRIPNSQLHPMLKRM